eukprot:CAMPEP_0194186410 /NCGR_PEP_ID=MMETSP0154-20130528/47015_1 /TAXON_ID=1049557 /ORGANISM="Thalassiothrix antarctica, Strain L6-D1" /LENGTH=248 /DNA_ID=CAMNT_0038905487 /DNA_START=146 /DNA_END=888 /DNA_ORIENTATION=+
MVSLNIIQKQLAPLGILRAAVNLSNPLLIKTKNPSVTGVSPSLAGAIASRLEVPLQLVEFEHPDDICNALKKGGQPWDIALIAADPDRASQIDFTPAYCEIQATCMVPIDSPLGTFDDFNKEGVRVSVKGGGAYDLWLTRNWNEATMIRSRTLDESYLKYIDDDLEALAGLRPRLLEDLEKANNNYPSHRLIDGSFMAVQQAIGCIKQEVTSSGSSISPGEAFLSDFVQEVRKSGGLVEQFIEEHGMT